MDDMFDVRKKRTEYDSLFWKNFFSYTVLTFVGFMILCSVFLVQIKNYGVEEKKDRLDITASRAAQITEFLLSNQYSEQLEQAYSISITQLAADSDAYIVVCDREGTASYTADAQNCYRQPQNVQINKGTVTSVLSGTTALGISNLNGIFSDMMHIVGKPINNAQGENLGVVFVATPADSTMNLIDVIAKSFLIAMIGVLIMMLITNYVVTARMVRPLKEMATAAKSFAKGDFKMRVPTGISNANEIEELAVSFNNMAASLENLEQMRRSFVANVSHDFKTPMTTIAGFVDGILDGTIPPEREKEYLVIISNEVKRLSRLATRTLETARIESGEIVLKRTNFDICDMASRIILSFEKTINDKKADVSVDFDQEINVSADKDMIFQVIYNLVDNAVKFTPENGKINMEIRRTPHEEIRFAIRNTGTPINKEDLPYLFDRFYKADRSRGINTQGSGLGLHIAKTTINLHGGDVFVESNEEYTEFSFTLPM